MHTPIKTWVFDAYGTLFDPYSVEGKAENIFPGRGQGLSRLWRSRQLEYTWLRTLMNRYADFWQVTREALVYACHSLGLHCDESQQERLMGEYLHVALYPDARAGLEALAGRRLAILSNGTREMLEAAVEHAGLTHTFSALLSVDQVKTYKPNPIVYQLAVDSLNLEKNQIGFVSSNYWDAAGAAAFGLPAFWLNRAGATPDELGSAPTAILTRLDELANVSR